MEGGSQRRSPVDWTTMFDLKLSVYLPSALQRKSIWLIESVCTVLGASGVLPKSASRGDLAKPATSALMEWWGAKVVFSRSLGATLRTYWWEQRRVSISYPPAVGSIGCRHSWPAPTSSVDLSISAIPQKTIIFFFLQPIDLYETLLACRVF